MKGKFVSIFWLAGPFCNGLSQHWFLISISIKVFVHKKNPQQKKERNRRTCARHGYPHLVWYNFCSILKYIYLCQFSQHITLLQSNIMQMGFFTCLSQMKNLIEIYLNQTSLSRFQVLQYKTAPSSVFRAKCRVEINLRVKNKN